MSTKIERKSFEIIGIDKDTQVKSQFTVIAETPGDAKRISYRTKPSFIVEIVYPSGFEKGTMTA